METTIQHAAECMRNGNHRQANTLMRELEHHLQTCPLEALQQLLAYLQSSMRHVCESVSHTPLPVSSNHSSNVEVTYQHFVTLKLVKLCIVHGREQWHPYTSEILNSLFHYALTMSELFVQHVWRPVVSELCTNIAIMLKLQCIVVIGGVGVENDRNSTNISSLPNTTNNNDNNSDNDGSRERVHINEQVMRDSAEQLLSLLRSIANNELHLTAGHLVLYRLLSQSYVEECGLYSSASQARGLPLRLHCNFRRMFEQYGLVPPFVHLVFAGLGMCKCESTQTFESALGTLITCLSWYSHRFFEEDNSGADDTVEVFLINSNSNNNATFNDNSNNNNNAWDELLLSRQHLVEVDAENGQMSLCEVLMKWIMKGSIRSVPFTQRQLLLEIIQLLCSFKNEKWQMAEQIQFVNHTLSSCVYLCNWLPREHLSLQLSTSEVASISLIQLQQRWQKEQERQEEEVKPVQQSESVHQVLRSCLVNITLENAENLPILANTIVRIVQNYTECLINSEPMLPLLSEIASCTTNVLIWDMLMEEHRSANFSVVDVDEEVIKDSTMSCVHDLLRVWYTLALSLERGMCVANAEPLKTHCTHVFYAYLHCRAPIYTNTKLQQFITRIHSSSSTKSTNKTNADEHEDTFSESFSLSQLHLVAHIARCSARECCYALTSHLHQLHMTLQQLQSMKQGPFYSCHDAQDMLWIIIEQLVYEPLWVCFTLIATFIADLGDGEQVYTPRCFVQLAENDSMESIGSNKCNNNALVTLMESVLSWHAILQQGIIDSPAVAVGYVEVLNAYLRTYVEMEEEAIPEYAQAFDRGAVMVSCALETTSCLLRQFPFEDDSTTAICKLLGVMADKNASVRRYIAEHRQISTLYQFAFNMEEFHFFRRTRGYLIGFLLACSTQSNDNRHNDIHSTSSSTQLTSLSNEGFHLTFELVIASLINITEQMQNNNGNSNNSNSSVNDDNIMEMLHTLVGVLMSLHRQELISTLFPFFSSAARALLSLCHRRFYAKEMATEMVEFISILFTTCSVMLENSAMHLLLELTITGMEFIAATCVQMHSWCSVSGKEDEGRVPFCIATSKLLSAVAQWKALDCFLPDEEVRPLSLATIHTMATMLKHTSESTLRFPELEERVFTALVNCVESFTPFCVSYHESNVFFMAILYALNASNTQIQRNGLVVINSIVSCAAQAHSSPSEQAHYVCAELLKVNLGALIENKIVFVNIHVMARTVLTIAMFLSPDELSAVFAHVANEHQNNVALLSKIFNELTASAAMLSSSALQPSSPSQAMLSDMQSCTHNNINSNSNNNNNSNTNVYDQFENRLQDLLVSHRGASML